MSNVILQEFVPIDGLAADAKDSVDFVPEATQGDQAFGRRQIAFMDEAGLDRYSERPFSDSARTDAEPLGTVDPLAGGR